MAFLVAKDEGVKPELVNEPAATLAAPVAEQPIPPVAEDGEFFVTLLLASFTNRAVNRRQEGLIFFSIYHCSLAFIYVLRSFPHYLFRRRFSPVSFVYCLCFVSMIIRLTHPIHLTPTPHLPCCLLSL
jgi:hypothetical protein